MPTRHRGADEVERRASAWRQLSRPGVVHLGVVVFGLGLAFAAQEAFLTAFTEERRFEWISPFYAAYAAVLVLGRVALGSLPDRVGPRRTSLVSVAVLALFFVAMTQVETEPLFWLLGALAAAGNALLWPSLYSIAYARIATKAYANALCGFLVALAYMVGSVGFGLVGERGGIEAIYAGAAAVAIAAGLVLAIGYPRERERPLHSEAG
jgi:predicted MFS family arabinose efflux permease